MAMLPPGPTPLPRSPAARLDVGRPWDVQEVTERTIAAESRGGVPRGLSRAGRPTDADEAWVLGSADAGGQRWTWVFSST